LFHRPNSKTRPLSFGFVLLRTGEAGSTGAGSKPPCVSRRKRVCFVVALAGREHQHRRVRGARGGIYLRGLTGLGKGSNETQRTPRTVARFAFAFAFAFFSTFCVFLRLEFRLRLQLRRNELFGIAHSVCVAIELFALFGFCP